jgi:hypothetical protein
MSPLQGCLHTPFPVPISYSDFAPRKHTNQHALTFLGKRFPQPPCSASSNSLLPTMLTRHSVMTRRHLHCPLCVRSCALIIRILPSQAPGTSHSCASPTRPPAIMFTVSMGQNPPTNPDSWHRSVQIGVSVHNVMPVRGSVPSPLSCRHFPPTQYDQGPPRTETNAPNQCLGNLQPVILSDSVDNLLTPHFLTICLGTGGASIRVCLDSQAIRCRSVTLPSVRQFDSMQQSAATCNAIFTSPLSSGRDHPSRGVLAAGVVIFSL